MTPQADTDKLKRMLLWFEEQLPDHELEQPRVNLHIREELAAGEGWAMGGGDHIEASALCKRCHQSFRYTNGTSPDLVRENPQRSIDRATEALVREASRSKCWGDVPKPYDGPVAVPDGVAADGRVP